MSNIISISFTKSNRHAIDLQKSFWYLNKSWPSTRGDPILLTAPYLSRRINSFRNGAAEKMKVETEGGVNIVATDTRLDAVSGPKLKQAVELLPHDGGLKLVIDMDRTQFLDSSGCQVLLSLLRKATKNHGDVKIARPSAKALAILQLSRLDRVFDVHESIQNAVESFPC